MSAGDNGWTQDRTDVVKAIALVQQAVDGLRCDIADLKTNMTETLKELRRDGEKRQAQIDQLITERAVEKALAKNISGRVDDLEKRMKAVEKLMPVIKVIMWVGAALGVSIIALIWALITGQAQVVFP